MVSTYKPSKNELPDYIKDIIGKAISEIKFEGDLTNVHFDVMCTVVGTRGEYINAFNQLARHKLEYLKTKSKE